MEPFVFKSPRLPLIKAKQLQKAFPFLKLSAAQEATARALGYQSFYECSKAGTRGAASRKDQEEGIEVRVARYYHQAGALMGIGISPSHADVWVRGWGLTGSPTLDATQAVPDYYRLLDAAMREERGELSDDERAEEFWEADGSKYPDIDRAVRRGDGVVLAPCGKYPHYSVDPAVLAKCPPYLKGSKCRFHYEDDGEMLALMVKGFVEPNALFEAEPELNLVQYEWHHGRPHPEAEGAVLPGIVAAAMAAAEEMVVISVRFMPSGGQAAGLPKYAVACLRGSDFADFIKAKGELDTSKVVWYRDVERPPSRDLYGWLSGGWPDFVLPVFQEAASHKAGMPLYSYPFKEAPMASDEYLCMLDRSPLLALELDYEADDDEGDGGEDDNEVRPEDGGNPHLIALRELMKKSDQETLLS